MGAWYTMRKFFMRTVLIVLVLAVVITGMYVYNEYRLWNRPWNPNQPPVLIDIEEGKSARQIATQLKDLGVVHNIYTFLIVADLRGMSDKLQAGEYELKGTQSPYEILDMIAKGERYLRSIVIPEGLRQPQIIERFAEKEICPPEELEEFFRINSIFRFVIAQAPDGSNAALEGALFPDTYYLQRNTPTIKVFERLTRRFDSVFNELLKEAEKKEEETGKTWWWKDNQDLAYQQQTHQAVVLASIVEKEARRAEDRPLVASVFVNRLKKKMPLQADSTIHYAINDWSRPLTLNDLEVDSPYNTYKNTGLPPAAICNPGKACLQAALMPPETDYLYFISMPNGETKFTANYNEFLQWKQQMKQERRNNGSS